MDIPHPESDRLVLDGCRRLTGPSLVWNESGAIIDVLVDGFEMSTVLDRWQDSIDQLLAELDWPEPRLAHRQFENGFSFLLAAPIDQLYGAVQILETAWYFCACRLLQVDSIDRAALLEDIRVELQQEKNPALIELAAAAESHGVDLLVDDDLVAIGHGRGSTQFALDRIPSPEEIDWQAVHNIPVAMITGTNGKSTCVRLLDGIARAAGQVSGVTSTDFVRVGDEVLDEGDYSGPGGARLLLRDRRLEVAFLEVARGGILRRGLPVRNARAALITNVACDHLGQYGVNNLQALAATKYTIRKALADEGVLVINADDRELVAQAAADPHSNTRWFSLDPNNPVIDRKRKSASACAWFADGMLIFFDGRAEQPVIAAADIPMTLGGAARHNIQNALGVILVADAMGYSMAQSAAGLVAFNSDERDNPGRLNLFRLPGRGIAIVDFAHNGHGVSAVAEAVSNMAARRKWVMTGSAGDRSDADIAAIVDGVCATKPDFVLISELENYLRGRQPGEVSQLMRRLFLENGVPDSGIFLVASPLEGVKQALESMATDDLALFLVLSERQQVLEYLSSLEDVQ